MTKYPNEQCIGITGIDHLHFGAEGTLTGVIGIEQSSTGDPCVLGRDGAEPGEVQLWYYTPAAVDSGTDVRLVVTDPEDVPIIGADSAITIAFAPVSSLPTLPPAALVG